MFLMLEVWRSSGNVITEGHRNEKVSLLKGIESAFLRLKFAV